MQYDDAVYGPTEISEPLLLDLMTSTAVQRLKGITQHGITARLGITPPFSRFDHSVGAMLLVRRLGARLDEQVGALLHDVSHTAFSHVVDFVCDDQREQSYHETEKAAFVARSDLPAVLGRHGLDWRAFLDEAPFTLLEQPSPALCADRLDYFFRDLEFLALATRDEIHQALAALVVIDGKIVVTDTDTARWLAYTYIEADRASWSNFREVGLYQLTAEAIKAAIRLDYIEAADWWGTDESLWQTLRSIDNPEVAALRNLISAGTRFTWDADSPAFRVATKVRSIDPPVARATSVVPLSSLDATFKHYREDYLADKRGPWPMRIVSPPKPL